MRDVVVADVLVLVEVRSRASHPLATVTELVVRAKLLVQPLRYTTPLTADSTDPVKQYKLILIIIINDDGDCMLKQSFVSTHLTGTQLQFLVSAQVVFKYFPPLQSCVAFSFPMFFPFPHFSLPLRHKIAGVENATKRPEQKPRTVVACRWDKTTQNFVSACSHRTKSDLS